MGDKITVVGGAATSSSIYDLLGMPLPDQAADPMQVGIWLIEPRDPFDTDGKGLRLLDRAAPFDVGAFGEEAGHGRYNFRQKLAGGKWGKSATVTLHGPNLWPERFRQSKPEPAWRVDFPTHAAPLGHQAALTAPGAPSAREIQLQIELVEIRAREAARAEYRQTQGNGAAGMGGFNLADVFSILDKSGTGQVKQFADAFGKGLALGKDADSAPEPAWVPAIAAVGEVLGPAFQALANALTARAGAAPGTPPAPATAQAKADATEKRLRDRLGTLYDWGRPPTIAGDVLALDFSEAVDQVGREGRDQFDAIIDAIAQEPRLASPLARRWLWCVLECALAHRDDTQEPPVGAYWSPEQIEANDLGAERQPVPDEHEDATDYGADGPAGPETTPAAAPAADV